MCGKKTKVQSLGYNRFLLLIYCTENATLISINDNAAICSDSSWNDLSMRCYCDCQVNVNFEGVLLGNFFPATSLKHGETLSWSCKDGYRNASSRLLACDDGLMETPKCVPNPESESKKPSADKTHITSFILIGCILGVAVTVIVAIISSVRYLKSRRIKLKSRYYKGETVEVSIKREKEASETDLSALSDENTRSVKNEAMAIVYFLRRIRVFFCIFSKKV